MELKRMYVTFQGDNFQRKKVMKLDTTDFTNMTRKIKNTFSLPVDEHYIYHGRVEMNGPLVELEDVDGDILEDLVEVSIRKSSLELDTPFVPDTDGSETSGTDTSLFMIPTSPSPLDSLGSSDLPAALSSPSSSIPISSSLPCMLQLCMSSSEALDPVGNPPMIQQSFQSSQQESCNSVPVECSVAASSTQSSGHSSNKVVFDTGRILKQHPKGTAILDEYNKNRCLSPTSRKQLIAIMSAELVSTCGYYPTMEQKHAIGRSIVTFFPEMKDRNGETGYEHIYCSKGGQSGYLIDKLKNIRRQLPTSARMRTEICEKNTPKTLKKTPSATSLLTEEDLEECQAICRNTMDKRKVMEEMKRCQPNRQLWIQEKKPYIKQIFERYPRFRDIPELIQQDFKLMFPDAADSLLKKWDKHSKGLLAYAAKCKGDIRRMVEEYESHPRKQDTQLFGFLVLLKLLPSYNTRGKGRLSQVDAERYVIQFHEVNKPLAACVQEAVTQQPSLLVMGTKSDVQQLFLQVEDFTSPLQASSIVNAFDSLFKAYYVFNLAYPTPVHNWYLYLQTQIFGLDLQGMKMPPRIRELAAAVQTTSENLEQL